MNRAATATVTAPPAAIARFLYVGFIPWLFPGYNDVMRRRLAVFAATALGVFLTARAVSRLRTRRFDDRVVVITGGARGLGLALAREFARRGARLALIARDADELERAKSDLARDGWNALTLAADVTDQNDTIRSIAEIVARFGRIDILVNDAGIITVGPLRSMTRDDYERALATHFWGAYNAVEAAWAALVESRGAIVNVTSIGGRISVPHLLPYSVSKFATVGFSEGLRAEARRYGITVTTVTPGLMRTGSPRNASFKGDNRAEYSWFMLSDSLPLISVSSTYAARRIVDACAAGEAEVSIGPLAWIATRAHGLAPGLVMRLMEFAAVLLPHSERLSSERGYASETALTRSPLTSLTRGAERRNNERH